MKHHQQNKGSKIKANQAWNDEEVIVMKEPEMTQEEKVNSIAEKMKPIVV